MFGHLSLHLLSVHALLGRLVGITLTGAAVRVALLVLLIPQFGLAGAAAGAAVAVLLEQALTVATALNRFRLDTGSLIRQIWRPIVASAVMAAIVAVSGLGWSNDPELPGMIEAVILGAATYTVTMAAAWFLAGQPRGAETDIITLLLRRGTG